jgi:hypothetical protein
MSHDLYKYGTQKPIYFKLTLNGVGVEPVLAAEDIKVFKDGVFLKNIGSIVTLVTGGGVTGIYKWTPEFATDTQCEVLIINIKDASGGAVAFNENTLIIATGGNASARFSG